VSRYLKAIEDIQIFEYIGDIPIPRTGTMQNYLRIEELTKELHTMCSEHRIILPVLEKCADILYEWMYITKYILATTPYDHTFLNVAWGVVDTQLDELIRIITAYGYGATARYIVVTMLAKQQYIHTTLHNKADQTPYLTLAILDAIGKEIDKEDQEREALANLST
jgi:hypothetical protein